VSRPQHDPGPDTATPHDPGPDTATPHAPVRVGLLVFDGCDLLDLGGPYEVLLTADRLQSRRKAHPRIEVVTLGCGEGPFTAYGGLGLLPHQPVGGSHHLDAVVVPGTIEVEAALADEALVSTVRELAAGTALVTSVCTGSFLLAEAGLLQGHAATTHHEDLEQLAARGDVGRTVPGVRLVDDGTVVTAGGLSCGLDLGLHLVQRLVDDELARATAQQVAHPYPADRHQQGA